MPVTETRRRNAADSIERGSMMLHAAAAKTPADVLNAAGIPAAVRRDGSIVFTIGGFVITANADARLAVLHGASADVAAAELGAPVEKTRERQEPVKTYRTPETRKRVVVGESNTPPEELGSASALDLSWGA